MLDSSTLQCYSMKQLKSSGLGNITGVRPLIIMLDSQQPHLSILFMQAFLFLHQCLQNGILVAVVTSGP